MFLGAVIVVNSGVKHVLMCQSSSSSGGGGGGEKRQWWQKNGVSTVKKEKLKIKKKIPIEMQHTQY